MVRHSRRILILGLAAALAACGLPEPLRLRARTMSGDLESGREAIEDRAEAYRQLAASDEFEFFAPYAEDENWAAAFDDARRLVESADSLYRQTVPALLEENRSDDATTLRLALAAVADRLAEARSRAGHPAERQRFLLMARDSAGAWIDDATARLEAVDTLLGPLRTRVATASEDFPEKSDQLDALWGELSQVRDSAAARLTLARTEGEAARAGRVADYAALSGAVQYIRTAHAALSTGAGELDTKVGELYRSYSRVLTDMRQEYYVQIGRTSWDNSSDAVTDVNYTYPVRHVSPELFGYIASLPANSTVAEYSDGFFGENRSVRIDQPIWQALEVDWKAGWPSARHDAAGYWVSNWFTRNYHQYLLVENGDTATTDWVEVDEDTYAQHIDNLGMAILAKPYGLFEDEVIRTPSPPGIAYVDNPRYGEWRTGADGRSFWHWYGQYAFFAAIFGGGPFRYGRTDYGCWQQSRAAGGAFYGCNRTNPTYGTWGRTTRSSARYRGTTFAGRGGFRMQDPSVRGAGPIGRGRGPAGAGK